MPPLDLVVEEGAFVTVAVPFAYRRTLLHLCSGLASPDRGRVWVLGGEPAAMTRLQAERHRRRIGVGLNVNSLVSNLTIRDNLLLPLAYAEVGVGRAADQRVDEVLEMFDLRPWMSVRPHDAPPETRKRTVLARAVVRRPALALLEDPTAALSLAEELPLLTLCREQAGTVLVAAAESTPTLDRASTQVVNWCETGAESVAV